MVRGKSTTELTVEAYRRGSRTLANWEAESSGLNSKLVQPKAEPFSLACPFQDESSMNMSFKKFSFFLPPSSPPPPPSSLSLPIFCTLRCQQRFDLALFPVIYPKHSVCLLCACYLQCFRLSSVGCVERACLHDIGEF